MNGTARALHEAIAQVSETVGLVSEVGKKISVVSSSVAAGAEAQSRQLNETFESLALLSESAGKSALRSKEAHGNAKQAAETIHQAKETMGRMLDSMDQISGAADSTANIAGDIDAIAKETGSLAHSTVAKTARMRISAGGFGVVAQEIRKLSKECSETARAMKEFEPKIAAQHREEFEKLIVNLLNIARSRFRY